MNDNFRLAALFQKAVEHHGRGALIDALREYDAVLRLNPRLAEAHCNRSFVLHGLKRFDQALDSCNRAIALKSGFAEAYHSKGIILRELNRLDEAIQNYDRAIALKPGFVETHNNRGIALRERGRLDPALRSFDEAIRLRPAFAEAHYNRGSLLQQLKRPDEALRSCNRAIALRADFADAYIGKGNALKDLKRPEEALQSYNRALQFNPRSALAFNNGANALQDLGRFEEALRSHDRAIALDPDFADAYHNRGNALRGLKRLDDALQNYDRAIALQPDIAEAHSARGAVLSDLKRPAEAIASLERAIELKPDLTDAYIHKGNVLRDLKRSTDALACFERALELSADSALARNNRARTLLDLRRLDEAIEDYDRAITLDPDFTEARIGKGICSLLVGKFEDGWPNYEWRRKKFEPAELRGALQPLWTGREELDGKSLYIRAEQGLGDTIQFCRYAKLAQRRGADVTLASQPQLMRLLKGSIPDIHIADQDETPKGFDYYIPLLNMPLAFHTNLDNCPADTPYLRAEQDRIEIWRDRIGTGGFRVGIAWQGTPGVDIDAGRSFPAAHFERLSRIPGVRLISLQKNAGIEQLASLPPGMNVETLGDEFDAGPDAFIDTAAVMENLDLIITSDTAIAHLGGALGRSTWIALQDVPDWRWLLKRSDSPWYPSVKLFRQAEPGDWSGVFAAMETQLAQIIC